MRRAVSLLERGDAPESFWYSVKRRVLGPPLVNEQLGEQRLSKPLALGVLSCDGISSANYGSEEILIMLLPVAGLAAFTLILPMTLVVLFVMALVVLSYREVVMVYIRPAGSYTVARQNLGPRIAQVTAVALLIDYVVTVAVQTVAGTAAIASAFPAIGPYRREITIGVILLMCYGNLRGIREAGRAFAVPSYLFAGAVSLMIVVGVTREALGDLGRLNPHALAGHYPIGSGTSGIISFAMILTLARAFANGGASLTGIEAVSDATGAFRPPEGVNARRVLVMEGFILGFLVAGISWLAHATYATPRLSGFPTVLAQEAELIFGTTIAGHALYYLLLGASALILYTGGNTSFNGFPYLASYVAGDAFLPRWLLKRGHRLVFSNGIIILTVAAVALVIIRGQSVNDLVPLYAIGVFTAFSMAGFGMAKYHRTHREQGWRRRTIINGAAGVLTAIVVVIFAIVKFTEGAWLVVILFPILVYALIRLNKEYRMEARVLEGIGSRPKPPEPPTYARRSVYVFVDQFDVATIAALRYARSLRPTSLRAVHFVLDSTRADKLRRNWLRANTGIVLDFVDCPDRRLARVATDLVGAEAAIPGVGVTVILPRRSYSPLLGRLLHDRTADKIAAAVSNIPHAAATIVPFDVRSRLEVMHERQAKRAAQAQAAAAAAAAAGEPGGAAGTAAGMETAGKAGTAGGDEKITAVGAVAADVGRGKAGDEGGRAPAPAQEGAGVTPIGALPAHGKAMVEGRVYAVEIRPVEQNTVLAAEVADSTGQLTALFYGRSHIAGLDCGCKIRFRGRVGIRDGRPVMINPAYELLPSDATGETAPGVQ